LRNVAEAILNASANQHVEDLVATCHEITTRNSRLFQTIFFTSPSIPGLEVSATQRYVVVTAEGHPDAIWEHFTACVPAPIVPNLPPVVDTNNIINNNIFTAQKRAEDIARVHNKGFEVDDDNHPAPENVPGLFDAPLIVDSGLFEGQSWGWDGIDHRQTAGGGYNKPSFCQGFTPIGKTYLELFVLFFPMKWLSNLLLPRTSMGLVNAAAAPLTFGKLLRFLAIRLLMATCSR
jgi:hypothetical protein